MSSRETSENEFLKRLTEITEANITNPQFGVSMLAKELGISRFMLHRKINAISKITASQFINQVRLQKAKDILRHTNSTVSDVAFQTGFNSTSYFIKCFHEYYGYPPGDVGNRDNDESNSIPTQINKKRQTVMLISFISVLVIVTVLLIVFKPFSNEQNIPGNLIAVLSFIDESPEESNEHIINGLRKEIQYKLEVIKNLNVIPWLVTDSYSISELGLKEIAKRLNADFILYGSGQKIGQEIKIDLQLYNVKTGLSEWARPFKREIFEDKTFELQEKVALEVVDALKIHLTPHELERINKRPTENTEAWELYLLGDELFNKSRSEYVFFRDSSNLSKAIDYFEQAIELDNEFALAYAKIAQAYFTIERRGNFGPSNFMKKYISQINYYADKALVYDTELPESLIAKGMYYYAADKREHAIPWLEGALERNANSYMALLILTNIYRLYYPSSNTEKTLELTLKMNKLQITGKDSLEKSNFYVHLSDAFSEAGFSDEGKYYLRKAQGYNPENNWAIMNMEEEYYKMKINPQKRIEVHKRFLKENMQSELICLGRIAVSYYNLKDYANALIYFDKLKSLNPQFEEGFGYYLTLKQLNMNTDSAMVAIEARKREIERKEPSREKHAFLSQYYAIKNNPEKAIEHMRAYFSFCNNNFPYYIFWTYQDSLVFSNLLDNHEFTKIITDRKNKFWDDHKRIKKNLKKKGLWPEELL